MSLADVIVGGAIATAGSAAVTLASWKREARARDRALRVEIGRASVAAVTVAREATANLVDRKVLPNWNRQLDDAAAAVLPAFEEVLALGKQSSIDACEKMLVGLFDLAVAVRDMAADVEPEVGVVLRARVWVLAPGVLGWRKRRKITELFRRAPG